MMEPSRPFRPTRPLRALAAGLLVLAGISGAADAQAPGESPRNAAATGAPSGQAEATRGSATEGSATRALDLPRLARIRDAVMADLRAGRTGQAEARLTREVAATPMLPELRVLQARAALAREDRAAALAHLEGAVDLGFDALEALLTLPDYRALADAPGVRALAARSAALPAPDWPRPAPLLPPAAERGFPAVRVGPSNLDWRRDALGQPRLAALTAAPRRDAAQAVGLARKPTEAERGAVRLLNRYVARGTAAGMGGLLYDNRDGEHSAPDLTRFAGLTRIHYEGALHKAGLGRGLGGTVLFDRPTLGNSSTAYTKGIGQRSLPRAAMTRAGGPEQAFAAYAANHVYVYPEHRDHDEWLDMYPANWPYMLISQGSSYSDEPILRAAALVLAALRPATPPPAHAEGLLAPTVQMLLRRSLRGVRSLAQYQSARAHPSVFTKQMLGTDRAVARAQALAPEDLPPQPVLRVIEEDFADRAGLDGRSERLFDTPGAVARIWRGFEGEKHMLLEVAARGGPWAEQARFDWAVLRGDRDRLRIEPLQDGRRARLTIGWHERFAIGERRRSDRIDIAVFARHPDGDGISAPAFVSVLFPTHQARGFSTDPQGRPQLAWVDYTGRDRPRRQDPLLFWRADWRDEALRDAAGRITGWRRRSLDAGGVLGPPRRIDAESRPPLYGLEDAAEGLPRLVEHPSAAE